MSRLYRYKDWLALTYFDSFDEITHYKALTISENYKNVWLFIQLRADNSCKYEFVIHLVDIVFTTQGREFKYESPMQIRVDKKQIVKINEFYTQKNTMKVRLDDKTLNKIINQMKFGKILRIKVNDIILRFSLSGSKLALLDIKNRCDNNKTLKIPYDGKGVSSDGSYF